MEMVNAGILPATVTITQRAKLWSSVFHNITPQPNIVIANQEDLAWAVRKNNPKFKELVDRIRQDPRRRNVVRQHPDAAISGE